ncbi:unnamed protein product [Sphagnum tenellum]
MALFGILMMAITSLVGGLFQRWDHIVRPGICISSLASTLLRIGSIQRLHPCPVLPLTRESNLFGKKEKLRDEAKPLSTNEKEGDSASGLLRAFFRDGKLVVMFFTLSYSFGTILILNSVSLLLSGPVSGKRLIEIPGNFVGAFIMQYLGRKRAIVILLTSPMMSLSPFIVSLEDIYQELPYLVPAAMSLSAGLLYFYIMPDTAGRELPEEIDDVRNLYKPIAIIAK